MMNAHPPLWILLLVFMCRDDILVPYFCLSSDAVGPNFLLTDNNMRPDKAHLVNDFLKNEHIWLMDWSARTPDLNPIDHVWYAQEGGG